MDLYIDAAQQPSQPGPRPRRRAEVATQDRHPRELRRARADAPQLEQQGAQAIAPRAGAHAEDALQDRVHRDLLHPVEQAQLLPVPPGGDLALGELVHGATHAADLVTLERRQQQLALTQMLGPVEAEHGMLAEDRPQELRLARTEAVGVAGEQIPGSLGVGEEHGLAEPGEAARERLAVLGAARLQELGGPPPPAPGLHQRRAARPRRQLPRLECLSAHNPSMPVAGADFEYRPFPNEQARNRRQGSVEVPLFLALLRVPRDARVLEVGCGRGIALGPIVRQRAPARLVGLDNDQRLLDEAAGTTTGLAVELICADVRALPFADASFDVVIDFGTTYHIGRPLDALREITRVLLRAAGSATRPRSPRPSRTPSVGAGGRCRGPRCPSCAAAGAPCCGRAACAGSATRARVRRTAPRRRPPASARRRRSTRGRQARPRTPARHPARRGSRPRA